MVGNMHVHTTSKQSNTPETGYNFFIRLNYFGIPTQHNNADVDDIGASTVPSKRE